jgi:hypothetical protein
MGVGKLEFQAHHARALLCIADDRAGGCATSGHGRHHRAQRTEKVVAPLMMVLADRSADVVVVAASAPQ